MLLSQQLHLMTDLVQSVIGALETGNYKLAEHAANKLAKVVRELHRSYFVQIEDELGTKYTT